MLHPLRTVAILMLLAGISLGVFASRAAQSFREPLPPPGTGNDAGLEGLVRLYQEDFRLTPPHADQIRRALLAHDQAVRTKFLELRQIHAEEFRSLHDTAYRRIREVLLAAGVDPARLGEPQADAEGAAGGGPESPMQGR
jgi:hypothetical protein